MLIKYNKKKAGLSFNCVWGGGYVHGKSGSPGAGVTRGFEPPIAGAVN